MRQARLYSGRQRRRRRSQAVLIGSRSLRRIDYQHFHRAGFGVEFVVSCSRSAVMSDGPFGSMSFPSLPMTWGHLSRSPGRGQREHLVRHQPDIKVIDESPFCAVVGNGPIIERRKRVRGK